MNWTPNQRKAIEAAGRDVLVSAGAGSGKTAVLAERCAYLVTDANPPTDMDRLLVVTFTEAAAEEMRLRIGRALRDRLDGPGDQRRVRAQLVRLDLASISTLHAFCRRTLVRNFAAADLDPGFALLDENEAATLRDEVLRSLFDELTIGTDDAARTFDELRHQYGSGRDEAIGELVRSLSEFLGSLPDPAEWRDRVLAHYQGLSQGRLSDEWRAVRRDMLRRGLSEPHDALLRVVDRFADSTAAAPWVEYARSLADRTQSWLNRLEADADAVCGELVNLAFDRIPVRNAKVKALPAGELAEFDAAKAAVESAREAIASLKKLDARYSETDWAEGLARIAPHVETLFRLASEFDTRYSEAKRALNALDFSDLERRMLNLLRGSPATTQRLRDQFDFVLVDEYQDINPLQAELLRLVSRADDVQQANNLFCVGDVKQSIYRFRLAEPNLFVQRQNEYSDEPRGDGGLRVDLPENFRSQPPVLDAINRLMVRLMTRELGGVDYDERTRLRAGTRADVPPAEFPPVELHLIEKQAATASDTDEDEPPREEREAARDQLELEAVEQEAVIAGRRLLELKHERPRMRWSDVAILMRAPRVQGTQVARVLGRMGIPSLADRAGGLFEAREVRDLLALLALLDNAQQDIPLAAVLRSPLCAAPSSTGPTLPLRDADLATIRLSHPHGPFHRAVAQYVEQGDDARLRAALRDFTDRLQRWRGMARRETASDLIAKLFAETSYPDYVAALPDGAQRRANLLSLHERARQFGTFSRQGLPRFLRFLEELQERDADLAAGAPPGAADDVVRLTSIHRAKGLEFSVVVLLRAGKRFNFNDQREAMILDRSAGLGLKAVDPVRRITYPTLAHRAAAERIRAETLSEELRLLYVALTRARDKILVIAITPPAEIDALTAPDPQPDGPLSLSLRRGAPSMLDWVLMALQAEPLGTLDMTQDAATSSFFSMTRHPPPERIEDSSAATSPQRMAILEAASQLDALPGAAAGATSVDDANQARAIIEKLGRVYAADTLTAIPSIVAVSDLKRRWNTADEAEAPALHSPAPAKRATRFVEWRRPRCTSGPAAPTPTDRGTWTHLFLQHLDAAAPCDADDLQRQLELLVLRGRLHADEAASIDLHAAAWFFDQPQGREFRAHAARLSRETPFVMAVEPTKYIPDARPQSDGDFLVVRGIIDVIYRTDAGLVILDWKTDAGSDAVIDERIRLYTPQLDIYARAAAQLFNQPVTQRRLVFLHARRIEDV